MKTEERTVYVADDGTVHATAEACQKHEEVALEKQKALNKLSVYRVSHNFEATEGRGYFGTTFILSDASEPVLLQYCLDEFGAPLSAWYGTGYYETWKMSKLDWTAPYALDRIKNMRREYGHSLRTVLVCSKPLDGHPDLPEAVWPWPRKPKK